MTSRQKKASFYAMVVLVSPFIGWIAAFVLIFLLIHFYRTANRHALEPWSGRHYSFEAHKLRFYLHDDTIWIPEADVQKVIRPKVDTREARLLGADYGTVPDHAMAGFTEAGLLRLVATRTNHRRVDPQMIKFRNWLEKQALPNVRRLPESAS